MILEVCSRCHDFTELLPFDFSHRGFTSLCSDCDKATEDVTTKKKGFWNYLFTFLKI